MKGHFYHKKWNEKFLKFNSYNELKNIVNY